MRTRFFKEHIEPFFYFEQKKNRNSSGLVIYRALKTNAT